MVGLQNALVATASVQVVAVQQVSYEAWDKIYMGKSCLATAERYGGVPVGGPVTFSESCSDSSLDVDWYMDFSGPYGNETQQPFTIRAGGYDSDRASNPKYPGGLSTWCLSAGGIDSNSSLMTVLECNGSPQQRFRLSWYYNITNLTEAAPYKGHIELSDSDGKCLDGTGNVLSAQICMSFRETQIWGHCRTRETYGPYYYDHRSNCPDPTTAVPTLNLPVAVQQVSFEAWDKIYMGKSCLAATEWSNGAPVTLSESCSDRKLDVDWYMDFSGPYGNETQQPFTIRAGGYESDLASDPKYPGGLSTWCLSAGGVDSNSSLVTLWECNGSPQQRFRLSWYYNITNLTEAAPYKGHILSDSNGKCLDGNGNFLSAQICMSFRETQIWGQCRTRETYSPYHYDRRSNCPDPTTAVPVPDLSSVVV